MPPSPSALASKKTNNRPTSVFALHENAYRNLSAKNARKNVRFSQTFKNSANTNRTIPNIAINVGTVEEQAPFDQFSEELCKAVIAPVLDEDALSCLQPEKIGSHTGSACSFLATLTSLSPLQSALHQYADQIRSPGFFNGDAGDFVPLLLANTLGQDIQIEDIYIKPKRICAHELLDAATIRLQHCKTKGGAEHYNALINNQTIEVAEDGNCLFRAILISTGQLPPDQANTSNKRINKAIQTLRNRVADELLQHPDRYSGFINLEGARSVVDARGANAIDGANSTAPIHAHQANYTHASLSSPLNQQAHAPVNAPSDWTNTVETVGTAAYAFANGLNADVEDGGLSAPHDPANRAQAHPYAPEFFPNYLREILGPSNANPLDFLNTDKEKLGEATKSDDTLTRLMTFAKALPNKAIKTKTTLRFLGDQLINQSNVFGIYSAEKVKETQTAIIKQQTIRPRKRYSTARPRFTAYLEKWSQKKAQEIAYDDYKQMLIAGGAEVDATHYASMIDAIEFGLKKTFVKLPFRYLVSKIIQPQLTQTLSLKIETIDQAKIASRTISSALRGNANISFSVLEHLKKSARNGRNELPTVKTLPIADLLKPEILRLKEEWESLKETKTPPKTSPCPSTTKQN